MPKLRQFVPVAFSQRLYSELGRTVKTHKGDGYAAKDCAYIDDQSRVVYAFVAKRREVPAGCQLH